jgi:hypothetical protein
MQKKQYAVQINNQAEFDELMEYYDRVGWEGGQPFLPISPLKAIHKQEYPFYVGFFSFFATGSHQDYLAENNLRKNPFIIITLKQAKEKIRHKPEYKEYLRKQNPIKLKAGVNSIQKLSNDKTPIVVELPKIDSKEEGKINFRKIKAGDKVWVELTVTQLHIADEITAVTLGGTSLRFMASHIKKHIPQKTEVEIAEEELNEAENILGNCFIEHSNLVTPNDIIESAYITALDRYYQARKTLEELKNYEKLNAKF